METLAPAYQRKATADNSDPCFICGDPVFFNKYSAGRGLMAHRACRQSQRSDDNPRPTHCGFCKEPFISAQRTVARGSWNKTCSKSCARKLEVQLGNHSFQKKPRYGELLTPEESNRRAAVRGEHAARSRRARLAGVKRDPYTKASIAERDDFMCGLCGIEVDMSIAWPAPNCGTVDHILPISRGGDDTLANVQLAHAICNLKKHNRV